MLILVTQPIDRIGIDWLNERGAEVLRAFDGHAWEHRAAEIQGIIVRGMRVDATLMDRLPALRVIAKHGVGVNTIDLAEASKRGIIVTNTPEANAMAVAEHAIGLWMSLARQIIAADRIVRNADEGQREAVRARTLNISGTRLAIVGLGNIGKRIARIAHGGFDCAIGVYDPYVPDAALDEVDATRFSDIAGLFTWATNAVIAAPATPQTRGLVGLDALGALGPEGLVICSSRGGIVDEEALYVALTSGAIAGAGIDVFADEPPPPDHPLLQVDNVVATPHMGGASPSSHRQQSLDAAAHTFAHLNGEPAPVAGIEPWLAASDGGSTTDPSS